MFLVHVVLQCILYCSAFCTSVHFIFLGILHLFLFFYFVHSVLQCTWFSSAAQFKSCTVNQRNAVLVQYMDFRGSGVV